MQADISDQGQPRLNDPIQVDAAILYDALEKYEKQLGFCGKMSSTMRRLRTLCDQLKSAKENDVNIRYLSLVELIELANILFDESAWWKDDLTLQFVDYLKKKTHLDQIELAYKTHVKSNDGYTFHSIILPILCLFPSYAEKNIDCFQKYPDIVDVLIKLYRSGVLTEDVYIAACENARYGDQIKRVFRDLERIALRDNKEIYLAVCESAQYIFMQDETRLQVRDIVSYIGGIYSHRILISFSAYSDEITAAFSMLNRLGINNEITRRIIIRNPEKAMRTVERIEGYVLRIASSLDINFLDAFDCVICLNIIEDLPSDDFFEAQCYQNINYLDIEINNAFKNFRELKATNWPSKNFHLYAFKWSNEDLSIVYAMEKLKNMGIPESNIEKILLSDRSAIIVSSIIKLYELPVFCIEKLEAIILCGKEGLALEILKILNKSRILNDNTLAITLSLTTLTLGDQSSFHGWLIKMSNAGILNEMIFGIIAGSMKSIKSNEWETKRKELAASVEGFIAFHQIGYLNHNLIDLICDHAEYARDIAQLFVCLKPIGLQSYLKWQETLFTHGQYAKDLKPIFGLMIKTGLFRCDDWYDIVLARKIPANPKNIIILDQETKALYHFNENGNKTEILEAKALEELNLSYLLTKEIEEGEIADLSHELNDKTRLKINDFIQSQGCKISSDHRELNFEMVCRNAKHAKDMLPLLQRLDSVGLLFQSIVVLAFENAQYIQTINEIFRHLNSVEILNKSNCEKIFLNSQYAKNILTAIESLYAAGLNREGLYQKEIAQLICEHPEYAQNIVSIAACLKQANITLDNDNLIAIARNVKYSAGILSACHALFLGHSLTQDTLNLIFSNPKQAIFIAFENGGIGEKGNDGLEDFENTQKVCKVFRETGAGLFFGKAQSEKLLVESPGDEDAEEREAAVKFEDLTMFCLLPEEVLQHIASQSGNNTLDEESRGEITRRICKAA